MFPFSCVFINFTGSSAFYVILAQFVMYSFDLPFFFRPLGYISFFLAIFPHTVHLLKMSLSLDDDDDDDDNNNENNNTFYLHEIIIIILRWAGHVARMEEGRSAFKVLTDKPTRKRPLGKPKRRWEDIIRMDLEEIGTNAGNWVDSSQDRKYWRALVNAVLNLRVL